VAVSLNHDVMTSFWLHKWPRTPKYDPSSVGITVWGYCCINMGSISMCLNTLYMSSVDVGSSLRRLSASTMTLCHHFDSISEVESQNLSQVVWGYLLEAPAVCPWTAYECAQTLCICLMWKWEAVWVSCQPWPWRNDIILTPQVTQNHKIWTK
jgi:hypothetical protein